MKNILIVLFTLNLAACSTMNESRTLSSVPEEEKGGIKLKDFISSMRSDSHTQKTLFTCSSEKWSDIKIVEEKRGGEKSYGLILESGSRDRPSVGAYTEGQTNVVFGLGKLVKSREGNITITGDFEGTQPVNNSKVSLVGKLKKREDGSPYLRFSLVEGAYKVETSEGHPQSLNYSFAFFSERMKTILFDSGVASSDEKDTLECSID